MKILFALFLLSITTSIFADTIPPSSKKTIHVEQSLEKRRKKLDSTLRRTDAIMDSLTGKMRYTREDTQRYLFYKEEARKAKEKEDSFRFWTKVGISALFGVLAIGFYGNRRGWWRRNKKEP